MRRYLPALILLGAAALAGAAEPPVTPARARAVSAECFNALIQYNEGIADTDFHAGEFLKAADAMERIIVLDPHDVDAYANAAWLAWSAGQTERAKRTCDHLLAANPDSQDACFEAGVFYMRIKDDATAVHWFGEAIAHGLTPPRSHFYGHALTRLGRTADALAFWRKLLADHPTDDVAKREIEQLLHPAPKQENP